VVDQDQEVVVDQGALLSAVETVEAWVADWNNIRTLLILMQTSQEVTQVVRDPLQVELHKRVQELINRLNIQVTPTVWIKLDSNSSVQTQLNKRIQNLRLRQTLSVKACQLEELGLHKRRTRRRHCRQRSAWLAQRAISKMKAFHLRDSDSWEDCHPSSRSGKRTSTSCKRARSTNKSWRVWWRIRWRQRCRWRSQRSWTASRARRRREASWLWAPRRR
jgi:hypothetical protein